MPSAKPAPFDRERLSFGTEADLYDRFRPGYPPEAARWMLGARACRVADVGAGTGIFTRVLAGLGHDVVAVEPDERMLSRLIDLSPGMRAVAGSAESIPLPAASLDAVTAAQSSHWFDRDAAFAEIARVLRPGGMFATVSNRHDDSPAWSAELSNLVQPERSARHGRDFGAYFDPPERGEFPHGVVIDADGLVGYVRSRSRYLVADEDEQRWLVEAAYGIARQLPERFELPLIAMTARAFLR